MSDHAPRRPGVRIWVALPWVAAIGAFQLWSWRSGLNPVEAAERLVDLADESAWGPVVFVLVYLVRPLMLIPATVLTVAAGFLFGALGGTVLSLIASTASAVVAFGIGRHVITQDVLSGEGGGRLARYGRRLRTRSFETVVTLRLLLAPFDLVNYAAGFLRIRLTPFIAGTIVGGVPATIAFVLAGAAIDDFDGGVPSLDPWTLVASAGMLVLSLGLMFLLRRRDGEVERA